jgi:hypothetical protein
MYTINSPFMACAQKQISTTNTKSVKSILNLDKNFSKKTKTIVASEKPTTHVEEQIAVLNKHKIVYCSIEMTISKDANNKLSKNSVYRTYTDKSGEQKIQACPKYANVKLETEYIKDRNGTLVFMGQNYNLIGIDVDNKEDTLEKFSEICDANNFDRNTLTSKTATGGIHYYFTVSDAQKKQFSKIGTKKFNDELIGLTSLDGKIFSLHVDVKYTNQLFYECAEMKLDNKVYKYEWVNTEKPVELPDFIFDEIMKYRDFVDVKKDSRVIIEKPIKIKTKKSKIELIEEEEETNEDINDNDILSNNIILKKKFENDVEIIKSLFDKCLSKKRFDDYADWLQLGRALHNKFGEIGFELFIYASKKSKKFTNEDEILNKYWNKFKFYEDGKMTTIATIYYFAIKDNKEEYSKIMKRHMIWNELGFTSVDFCKYIKDINPNQFAWKDKKLYCYNGKYWETTSRYKSIETFISNISIQIFLFITIFS